MEAPVATTEWRDAHSREVGEQCADVRRREHVQVRRILVGLKATHEAQAVLHPERIRNRADEDATLAEDAADLRDERAREANVLEELAGDDDVEALAVERKRLVDVGDDGRRSRAAPPSPARPGRRRLRRRRSRPGNGG